MSPEIRFVVPSVLLIGTIVLYVLSLFPNFKRLQGILVQSVLVVAFVFALYFVLPALQLAGWISTEKLDNTTLLLAVMAIAFGAAQFIDAKIQFAEAKMQASKMDRVAEEMSTRFIGFFPKNLHHINEIAKNATQRFHVMSDYVSYGYYSDPLGFEEFGRRLQDLASAGVDVSMVIYTRQKAKENYDTQFPRDTFTKYLDDKDKTLFKFCERFDRDLYQELKGYEANANKNALIDSLQKTFERLMFDRQSLCLKDLIERGVKIKQTDKPLPFFFWCEDGHEAVFAFLHEDAPTEREVTFRTRDSRLVESTFEHAFNSLWIDTNTKDIIVKDNGKEKELIW